MPIDKPHDVHLVATKPLPILPLNVEPLPASTKRNMWTEFLEVLRTDGPTGLYRGMLSKIIQNCIMTVLNDFFAKLILEALIKMYPSNNKKSEKLNLENPKKPALGRPQPNISEVDRPNGNMQDPGQDFERSLSQAVFGRHRSAYLHPRRHRPSFSDGPITLITIFVLRDLTTIAVVLNGCPNRKIDSICFLYEDGK